MRFHPSWMAASTLLVLGCETSGDDQPSEELARWSLIESARIGALDGGPYPIQGIMQLVPGPDQTILVPQGTAAEVPQFSASGELLRIVGRKGEGPGEFDTVTDVGWVGDTLWITDLGSRKVGYFSADGSYLGEDQLAFQMNPERPDLYPWTPRLLASEFGIMQPGSSADAPPGSFVPVFRTDRQGVIVDTLSLWSSDRVFARITVRDRVRTIPRPLRMQRDWAVSPGGTYFVHFGDVPQDSIAATDRVGAWLRIWDGNLEPVAERVLTAPLIRVSEDQVRAVYDSVAARMAVDDAERARILNEMLSLLPAQWQRSLADDVIVSDEGVVWIRRGDPPAGPREYWVLDQTAELIATVTVPERVSLLAAEENTVWGVYTDALDVQYAVRFDIVR